MLTVMLAKVCYVLVDTDIQIHCSEFLIALKLTFTCLSLKKAKLKDI